MIKTVIIEDEEPAAKRMESLLKECEPEIYVVEVMDSVEAGVKWFQTNPSPDLLILDIQLADGTSFEIFEQVAIDSFVIFTTAYDEFAIKAFELNSIDYLLKPIEKAKLRRALEKYHRLKVSTSQDKIHRLLTLMDGKAKNYKQRFIIHAGSLLRSIETSKIACFYSTNKDTYLITEEGRSYPIDFSLDKVESLIDPKLFFRINRQVIIHFQAIKEVHVLSKSRIKLTPSFQFEEDLMVSKAKTRSFREWLDE